MLKLNDEQKGMLAATVTYIIFGFSYLFSKMALNITNPIILLCARFSVTFITLNILVLTRIVKINLKGKPKVPFGGWFYYLRLGILEQS